MKALVVCPTYGRLPYLGRMMASFLSQDYDDKHLVIINDDNRVRLVCDYDNVTILNCEKRITVAEKRNLGVALGNYDVIFPLDDDDIFLPNRISNHLSKYTDKKAYRNIPCYIIYGDQFYIDHSPPNSMSFLKKEWFDIGGYKPVFENRADDAHIYEEIKKRNNLFEENNENDIDFVYHFGGVNYHLSCSKIEDIEEIAYRQLVKMDVVDKKFNIIADFQEYDKVIQLANSYKGNPLKIKHLSDGKIEI